MNGLRKWSSGHVEPPFLAVKLFSLCKGDHWPRAIECGCHLSYKSAEYGCSGTCGKLEASKPVLVRLGNSSTEKNSAVNQLRWWQVMLHNCAILGGVVSDSPLLSVEAIYWCHATCLVRRLFLGLYWPRSELSTLYVLCKSWQNSMLFFSVHLKKSAKWLQQKWSLHTAPLLGATSPYDVKWTVPLGFLHFNCMKTVNLTSW